jgi:hypothetical protein
MHIYGKKKRAAKKLPFFSNNAFCNILKNVTNVTDVTSVTNVTRVLHTCCMYVKKHG